MVSTIDVINRLLPMRMLMPLIAQMNAAVITLATFLSNIMMASAPKNPTLVAICTMILVGSIDRFFSTR